MKTLFVKSAVVGAVAMGVIAAVPASAIDYGTQYRTIETPKVRLACAPGQLTVVNRSDNILNIQKRSGRYVSLYPNYQAPMRLGSHANSLRIVNLKQFDQTWGKGFAVKVGSLQTNKFNCLIPRNCLVSLRNDQLQPGMVTTRFIECKQRGFGF